MLPETVPTNGNGARSDHGPNEIQSQAPGLVDSSPMGRFEDSELWMESMRLASRVIQMVKECDDETLARSLQESSIALPSLIADAYERGNAKESLGLLRAARGICAQIRTRLFLASRLECLPVNDVAEVVNMTHDVTKQVGNLFAALKRYTERRAQ